MRIVGDLRWDQLTSPEEWVNRFSGCDVELILQRRVYFQGCAEGFFDAGEVSLYPVEVRFSENTGTESKTMTETVKFIFYDDSSGRAFKSAIAQKYLQIEYDGGPYTAPTSQYCSNFTCWHWFDDAHRYTRIYATPSQYTVSILDNVKVDKSDI